MLPNPEEMLEPRLMGNAIPRVIHQVYLSRELPEDLAAVVDRVKEVNPEREHRFYDDQRMFAYVDATFGPEMAGYLRRIDPLYAAARADLFRYLLMYAEGGVYLDAKSLTERPLSDVLGPDDQFFVSQWNNADAQFQGFGQHPETASVPGGEFQQWWLASVPGHPLTRAAILGVLRNIDHYRVRGGAGVGSHGVLQTTGPIAYTLAIADHIEQHPHRRLKNERELGLAYSALPGLAHARADTTHYTRQWRPVVDVGGLRGLDNFATAAAVKAYWVLRWRLRHMFS